MYKTWDGRVHATEKLAIKHVENEAGHDLRNLVKAKVDNYKQASDLVLHMLENPEIYQQILSRFTAFEEQNPDEE
jgi:vacuolar-type H+-ATPase subunit E/Vma4